MRSTTGAGPEPPARVDPNVADIEWVREAILAGAVGAAVIAVFFLVVDSIAGRPLWTPHALGAALFRGGFPDPGEPIDLALVVGYTAVHGAVFTAVALIAAFEVLSRRPSASALRFLGLAAALFVGMQLAFFAFDALAAADAMAALGSGAVALANALAALAMAWTLRLRAARAREE